MSYTMIHILTAEKVLKLLDCEIDYSTYMLGVLAPDAVHAAKEYSQDLKERSHIFAPGLVWGRVVSKDDMDKWLNSIMSFAKREKDKYDKSFFLGYIVHLLTDMYSCEKIYVSFYYSLGENKKEAMVKYRAESASVNYYLYDKYFGKEKLDDILRRGRQYSIEGVFDKDLFVPRFRQFYDFEFAEQNRGDITRNEIITIENTKEVIFNAPEYIIDIIGRM